jgi:hypothetical protein
MIVSGERASTEARDAMREAARLYLIGFISKEFERR